VIFSETYKSWDVNNGGRILRKYMFLLGVIAILQGRSVLTDMDLISLGLHSFFRRRVADEYGRLISDALKH